MSGDEHAIPIVDVMLVGAAGSDDMVPDSQRLENEALCQSCGACCAYSHEWPRFSLESDEALALIPEKFVDDAEGRMKCDGERCTALVGDVGVKASCAVYAVRPEVCRTCQPGDVECQMARRHYNL